MSKSFDQTLKDLVKWNIGGYQYFMLWLQQMPATKETLFMFQIAKVGYQQNFYLYKTLMSMEFTPGDEESRTVEAAYVNKLETQIEKEFEDPEPEKEYQGKWEDIKELDRMMALEPPKLLTGEIEIDGTKSNGRTFAFNDWYKRLFPDGPKGITGTEGNQGEKGE